MMIRLDFTGRARRAARAIRIGPAALPSVAMISECSPRLPFKDGSIDELFVDDAIARRGDIAETLDELWRVSKPGALVHLRLPHASSAIAASRDPRPKPLLTLNTFNYYDPRSKPWDAHSPATFTVERARLRVAAGRGAGDAGLALARGPLALLIEKLANASRGSQYRFERWFAPLFGGFEEFEVVLGVVKQAERRRPEHVVLAATANGASEHGTAAGVDQDPC
jgi:hypothetical protein